MVRSCSDEYTFLPNPEPLNSELDSRAGRRALTRHGSLLYSYPGRYAQNVDIIVIITNREKRINLYYLLTLDSCSFSHMFTSLFVSRLGPVPLVLFSSMCLSPTPHHLFGLAKCSLLPPQDVMRDADSQTLFFEDLHWLYTHQEDARDMLTASGVLEGVATRFVSCVSKRADDVNTD